MDAPNPVVESDLLQATNWIIEEHIDQTYLPNDLLQCRYLLRSFLGWRMAWTNRDSNGVAHDLAHAVWSESEVSHLTFDNLLAIRNILSINSYKELVDVHRANRLVVAAPGMNSVCSVYSCVYFWEQ